MINTINKMMYQSGIGVVYLDEAANILSKDSNADEILSSVSRYWCRGKQFFCEDNAVKENILSFISEKDEADRSARFFVRKRADESPVSLSIFPVVDNIVNANGEKTHWVMLVKDPQRKPDYSSKSVARFYKLTNAEISLVTAVYQGVSLIDYAKQRGVKISTVRWTLDNVFSKTYTHSQSELRELANNFV